MKTAPEGNRSPRRRVFSVLGLATLVAASGLTIGSLNRGHARAPTAADGVSAPPLGMADAPPSEPRPGGAPPARLATLAGAGACVDVPVLLYHYIRVVRNPRDRVGWELSVTPPEFRAQMDWLRRAGGHPVTLAQLTDALKGGPALPPRAVALT